MKKKSIGPHVALIVLFVAIGLTMFTDGVRTVQILGLMASGAVCGVSLAKLIEAVRARPKE